MCRLLVRANKRLGEEESHLFADGLYTRTSRRNSTSPRCGRLDSIDAGYVLFVTVGDPSPGQIIR